MKGITAKGAYIMEIIILMKKLKNVNYGKIKKEGEIK